MNEMQDRFYCSGWKNEYWKKCMSFPEKTMAHRMIYEVLV